MFFLLSALIIFYASASSLVCYDWIIEFEFINTWMTAAHINTTVGQQAEAIISTNIKNAMLLYYQTTYFIVQQPLVEDGSWMDVPPEGAEGQLIIKCGFVGEDAPDVVDNIKTALFLPDFYLALNASTTTAIHSIDQDAVLSRIIVYDYNSTQCQQLTTEQPSPPTTTDEPNQPTSVATLFECKYVLVVSIFCMFFMQ